MKTLKRILATTLILICMTLMAPGSLPNTIQVNAFAKQSVTINHKSATLKTGQTIKLKLKNTNKKPIWKTSNKKIASVSTTGKVTAKSEGTATISAKLEKKTYKCKIIVKKTSKVKTEDTQEDTQGDMQVYIPATGKKYHKINNCGNMNPNKAKKISISEAKAKGYTPCSKCF